MTRFSQLTQLKQDLRTRSFEYGGHTFKVRIPLASENEAIQQTIVNAEKDIQAIEMIYVQRVKGLEPSEKVVFVDNDILVEGRSMREAASAEHRAHVQIQQMFSLLAFENDDGQGPLTYDQINEELPFTIQIELMRLIVETISPNLENTKKN